MIGKAQTAKQPSIDELLASIRQAIHERIAPAVEDRSPSVVHTKPAQGAEALKTRAGIPPAHGKEVAGFEAAGRRMKRTIVTTGAEGFAGLLGGDVRLEEALARLNQTGWRLGADAPPATPGLRPTIDDWTDAVSSPRPTVPQRPAASSASPTADAGRLQRGDPTPPILWGSDQTRAAPFREGELRKEEPMHDEHSGAPRSPQRPADSCASRKPAELLSSEAASAASSAFTRLADAMVNRSSGGERTFDEITREMLRPLLKSWLDENLPGLVERLVREEIERVARPGK